jgi:putative transporter protein
VKNYVSVFQDKIFLLYTLGTVFNGVIWLQIDNYIPVHLKESFIASSIFGIHISGAKMLSIMVFINTLIIVCFITTANRLTKEMKLIPQFLLGSIIFDLGMLFTIVFRSFWALFLLAILYTMGELICMPPSQVLRAEMMNENKLGTYSGFLNMAQPLASILAGAMISISAATGAVGVWLVFIVCAVLGLLLIIRAAHLQGIANQL